jgi:hypothetical protein
VGKHPIAGRGFYDLCLGEIHGSEQVALKLVRHLGLTEQDKAAARRVSHATRTLSFIWFNLYSYLQRLLSETRLWAKIQHPHILESHGICEHGALAILIVHPLYSSMLRLQP